MDSRQRERKKAETTLKEGSPEEIHQSSSVGNLAPAPSKSTI